MTGVPREQLPICSNKGIYSKFHELVSEQSPEFDVSYVLRWTGAFQCFVDNRLACGNPVALSGRCPCECIFLTKVVFSVF